MGEWTRRDVMVAGAAGAGALGLGGVAIAAPQPKPAMTTYRDPGCGCCLKWVEHARAAGYAVTVVPTRQMSAVKEKLGVPDALISCHTSRVGGYVIEGHAPLAAVDKLLKTKPKGVIGIAVPGMPAGSPGMEAHGGHDGHAPAFKTFAFTRAGTRTEFKF
jgi:hypothetical protein